jgi:3-hydroxyacyl-[acyl-carrier-protein] dehydratase
MSAMSETEAVPTPTETTAATPKPVGLDITEIMAILPHRYPFLLIDRVLEIERKERIVAIKNVTANEPQFMGHFPGNPIMPGVLMIESMAQAGGALLLTEYEDRDQKIMYFTGIEGAKFRRPVTPGDQLRIEVKVLNWRSRAVKMAGTITVDGKLVCEATITCGLVDKNSGAAVPKPGAAAETAE